ncbi:biopolymer transporter ExbD [Aquariibacter albus]|uniref:Biopolymer transporter ExbD n=1 Tax=Aquariibacter albus TaxID=2759899 RepID=A0A839HQH0_9BURK|nr:biopolymer transporter ExbD [Aquariibacter albus]MBB1161670.1 biopolymer transporter ExbD [Aquariibacter albus]
MPAMASRGGSRRRTVSEINMVPFIDVMLVLLIIFMVSAPLISPSAIDVPSVGQAKRAPDRVIEIVVASGSQLKLRVNGRDHATVSAADLAGRVKALQNQAEPGLTDTPKAGAPAAARAADPSSLTPVIISADRNIKYDEVVKVMDSLQRGGVQRIGLAVKTGS